jgi:N-acyl-L-homoserine lactone synthetase
MEGKSVDDDDYVWDVAVQRDFESDIYDNVFFIYLVTITHTQTHIYIPFFQPPHTHQYI